MSGWPGGRPARYAPGQILEALEANGGNVNRAAAELGTGRSTLHAYLARYPAPAAHPGRPAGPGGGGDGRSRPHAQHDCAERREKRGRTAPSACTPRSLAESPCGRPPGGSGWRCSRLAPPSSTTRELLAGGLGGRAPVHGARA